MLGEEEGEDKSSSRIPVALPLARFAQRIAPMA
jgi:hypothetical protein